MRNSTLASATFAQWLASMEPRADASPNQGGDDFRPIAASSIDHERLAALANEILAAAIKLAAMVEVAGQPDRLSCRGSHPQQMGMYADE